MNEEFDMQRLQQLTLAKCNASLTDDEAQELSELLAVSQLARDEYWQFIAVHSELEWELQADSNSTDVLAKQIANLPHDNKIQQQRHLNAHRALRSFLAIAACLTVGWFISGNLGSNEEGPAPGESIASNESGGVSLAKIVGKLTAIVPNSKWTFGRPGAKNAVDFRQGDTIWLDEGVVELRLVTNTVAVFEAPTIMQVVSADRVRVIDGGVKVEVAKGAEGFSVETSSAEVIDLGTVFSVNVADGNTDLVVFDGEVDLKLPSTESDEEPKEDFIKRFHAGEAVQVLEDGTLSRIVNVRQSTHQLDGVPAAVSVIDSVKDNNIREDFWSFYEIVPGGMQEDAPAFVDRPHQWNGLTDAGMPKYLLGADYVKTFNDDKVMNDLRIELELRSPAAVYVFMDKRLSPPEWLVEQFENTGDEIGIDEAFPERGNLPRTGPANSVERDISIWKLVTTTAGTVTLGPNGSPSPEEQLQGVDAKASMYGIVAVPLEGAL